MNTPLYMIAAICKDRGLGKDGQLLHRFKVDMEHFRETTKDQIVVMGRKTWDSLPDKTKPLPGRVNIVMTSNLKNVNVPHSYFCSAKHEDYLIYSKHENENYLTNDSIVVTTDKDKVIALAAYSDAFVNKKTYVIGGGAVYEVFKDLYTEIVLTEFDWESKEFDTQLFELDDSWVKDVRRCRTAVIDDKRMDFNYYVKK